VLVGDSEFGHAPVIRQLNQWLWQYVLGQRGNQLFFLEGCQWWQRLDALTLEPGDLFVLVEVQATASNHTTTQIGTYWKKTQTELWR
jgi:hypothetical protein